MRAQPLATDMFDFFDTIDTPPWVEIAAGAVTTALVVAWLLLDRRTERDVFAPWVVATALTLVALNGAPMGVVFAVVYVAAAQALPDVRVRHAAAGLGTLTVAFLMTRGIDGRLVMGAVVGSAVAGVGLWYVDRLHGHAVSLILIGGSALGIYINVPDTEQIVVLAAALPILALACVAFGRLRRSAASFETLVVIGTLVMSSGAVGARGRVESFIGVLGAIGVLVAEPIASWIRRGTRSFAVVLVAVHAAAVFVSSRIAGEYGSLSLTAAVALTLGAAVVVVLTIAPRKRLD